MSILLGKTVRRAHLRLTTLREKSIKIRAKVVYYARYVIFQIAEIAVPRWLFRAILERVQRLKSLMAVPGRRQQMARFQEDQTDDGGGPVASA